MGWKGVFFGCLARCTPVVLLLAAGCAGDGSGVSESDPVALEPTLASIAANIFVPICAVSGCHAGAGAPQGLRLESAGLAHQSLVGVPSAERPDLGLLRVSAGRPDASYLVWKIEGRAQIAGGRMPLGQPPLTEAQSAAINQWIADGAPGL